MTTTVDVFSEWDRIFKDPMTTAAAVDRLVHHSVILEMTGSSIRIEEAQARAGRTEGPIDQNQPLVTTTDNPIPGAAPTALARPRRQLPRSRRQLPRSPRTWAQHRRPLAQPPTTPTTRPPRRHPRPTAGNRSRNAFTNADRRRMARCSCRQRKNVIDARHDDVLSRLRAVQSTVTHLEKFPRERAIAACLRAQHFGVTSYGAIKNILRQGLDLLPLSTRPWLEATAS